MTYRVYLDRFDTASHLHGKNRTYENIKAAVLCAGRFSCFDIVTQKDAKIFTALCRDPGIEIDKVNSKYPWTIIKLRSGAEE